MTVPNVSETPALAKIKGARGLGGTEKAYLQELVEKYPKINITIASFSNSKQQEKYTWSCFGSLHNAAISENILEQMAIVPATAAKYEKYFAGYDSTLKKWRRSAERDGNNLVAFGVVINKEGKAGHWGHERTV